MIKGACPAEDLDLQAKTPTALAGASGAAHGMYWSSVELQRVEVGKEYEPGQFRTVASLGGNRGASGRRHHA